MVPVIVPSVDNYKTDKTTYAAQRNEVSSSMASMLR